MKKDRLILIAALLFASLSQAQNIGETLYYSQQETLGTARYRSMSGAFGSLGGDLTALAENPAGSAVFNNSFGSITLSSTGRKNDVSYFNNPDSTKKTSLNFNQVGAVFVFANGSSDSGLNKVTLGLSYNQTADFRNEFEARGFSNNSLDSYFLADAGNFSFSDIERRAGESLTDAYLDIGEDPNLGFAGQQAFLALEAGIIRPDLDNTLGNVYFSNLGDGPFDQQYTYITTGFSGKFTANLGFQVAKDYYFGLNLNSHNATTTRTTEFSELDYDETTFIDEVRFTNNLTSRTTGFSLNLGFIGKITDQFRAGLSYESPTWNTITEEVSQRLLNISNTENESIRANPNIITILPDYQLRTPGKLTASAALIFGKQGLISFDYSYKDYSSTKFSDGTDGSFNEQNTNIESTFRATSAFRLGGEYRYQNWSYRAGFRYEESPYKEKLDNGEYLGSNKGYSLGAGYNFGKIKVDLAYDRSEQERSHAFYPRTGFTNTAQINNTNNTITATVGLNF